MARIGDYSAVSDGAFEPGLHSLMESFKGLGLSLSQADAALEFRGLCNVPVRRCGRGRRTYPVRDSAGLERIMTAISVMIVIGMTKPIIVFENAGSAACCCASRIRYATYAA